MFHYIKGKLTEIGPNLAVVEAAGVGFGIFVSANTLSHVNVGEQVKLYTYENIREDAYDLYGFYSIQEKHSFEMLIGVSGVGPKAAMSILSSATPEALAMAVISGDEKTLTRAPGIGKKIAQRILLELKDKMSKEADGFTTETATGTVSVSGSSKLSDAVSALNVLGYSSSEISGLLKNIDVENTSTEDIIKQALKKTVK